MNKSISLVFVFIFLTAPFIILIQQVEASENSWTTVSPLPKPYYGVLGAAALDGKIYFLGEEISEKYDPATNNWTEIAPPPIYYLWSAVVACQDKIYVIGQPTQAYDPSTDSWENRTSLPETIGGYEATVVGNKIYVISGGKPAPLGIVDTSETTFVYDTANDSWSRMAPIPTPVVGYASAVLNDKIYIIGGGTATNEPSNPATTVQVFDPHTNVWTVAKPIPTGVVSAGAVATSGLFAPKRIYVVGGSLYYSGGGVSSDMVNHGTNLNQVYDPETEEWSSAAPIPEIRWSLSLVNVNDVLYAVGGINDTVREGVYYDQYRKSRLAPIHVQATEKYFPIGYEGLLELTPLASSTSPLSPSPSPSSTPTPLPSPSPTPSASPSIVILSPANTSYVAVYDPYIRIPLIFETNKTLSWVGCSLDGGNNNTISGNGTEIEISWISRSLTLYANDTAGNWEPPQTVYYEIAYTMGAALPNEYWLTIAGFLIAVIGIGLVVLLVFFKKYKKKKK